MEVVNSRFNGLRSYMGSYVGMMVSEDIPVNILIPVVSDQQTILIDGSSNYISNADILERLVLFAQIFSWDRETFLRFMMPSKDFMAMYSDNAFVLTDNVLRNGFGYWLLNSRREMNAVETISYKANILSFFDKYDVKEGVKKYKIKVVQAFDRINPQLQTVSVNKEAGDNIYILKDI